MKCLRDKYFPFGTIRTQKNRYRLNQAPARKRFPARSPPYQVGIAYTQYVRIRIVTPYIHVVVYIYPPIPRIYTPMHSRGIYIPIGIPPSQAPQMPRTQPPTHVYQTYTYAPYASPTPCIPDIPPCPPVTPTPRTPWCPYVTPTPPTPPTPLCPYVTYVTTGPSVPGATSVTFVSRASRVSPAPGNAGVSGGTETVFRPTSPIDPTHPAHPPTPLESV
jgi:hypothetical protein